jgi:serine/threonine protein kinase
MNLTPGTRLARYEVRALVGAGGMGEVYAAYDPDLEREVAIKVLHHGAATISERRDWPIDEGPKSSRSKFRSHHAPRAGEDPQFPVRDRAAVYPVPVR